METGDGSNLYWNNSDRREVQTSGGWQNKLLRATCGFIRRDQREKISQKSNEKGCQKSSSEKTIVLSLVLNERRASDKVAVLMNASTSAAQHYDDYYKSFAALDGKAQGTATVGGLIMAAMAALIKDGRISVLSSSSHWWIILVLAPPGTALVSVILAVMASRVTEVVVPFDAAEQIRESTNIVDLSNSEFPNNTL